MIFVVTTTIIIAVTIIITIFVATMMMIKIDVLLECLQLGREDCPTYSSSSKNAVADNLTDDPDISSHKMRGGEKGNTKRKMKDNKLK